MNKMVINLVMVAVSLPIPMASGEAPGGACTFEDPYTSWNDEPYAIGKIQHFELMVGVWLLDPSSGRDNGVQWTIVDCSNYGCVFEADSIDEILECLGMAEELVGQLVGNTSVEEPGLPPGAIRLDTLHYAVPGETPGEGGLYIEDDYWLSDNTLDMLGLFAIADAVLTGTPCGSEEQPAFCAD